MRSRCATKLKLPNSFASSPANPIWCAAGSMNSLPVRFLSTTTKWFVKTPETSFYVTGGTLRSDAPSYVERQADKELMAGLVKGEFCYVLTSRQMGKSSLMVRTASKLREQAIAAVVLDLTA